MGRNGHGVRAIRLAEGDEVVGVCICREGGTVLTVTENGKGRRSDIDTYRITARGGKGIRNYDVSRDKVAAVKIVDDVDDVLLSSQEGIIIRLHANEIPLQSRYGSGVRVMRLGENDKVMVLARTDHDDEAQTEKIDASEADAEPTAEQLAEMEAADARRHRSPGGRPRGEGIIELTGTLCVDCFRSSSPLSQILRIASSPKGSPWQSHGLHRQGLSLWERWHGVSRDGARTLPQRRAFVESGAATAVFLYALSCENGFQESPQTFLKPEISNDFSAENAQSARGGHSKSSRPVESAFFARSYRQVCLDFPLKLC